MPKKKKVNSDQTTEEAPKKQTIEEILEEGEELKAEAAIEDEENAKKVEEEAAVPEVEVDLDEEREKTKQEVLETVTKEVVEPLKQEIVDLKKVMSPEEKDEYQEFVDNYTEKNGKAPEWKEVAMFLEERAVAKVEQKQKEIEETKVKAEEAEKAKQEEVANNNFKIWQGQLEEMESKGILPKMEKAEKGDKGFDARVKLYGLMQNTWKSTNPLSNMWEVHAKYWEDSSDQPAGSDAPVSIGNGSGVGEDIDKYNYSEVHAGGQDLEVLIAKELEKVRGK